MGVADFSKHFSLYCKQCDQILVNTLAYIASSVTRLGDFLKFLASNFLLKVSLTFRDFWGDFKGSFTRRRKRGVFALASQFYEHKKSL